MAGAGNAVMYERRWAMPNSRTFTVKPIARFIRQWSIPQGRTLDIFPYAGKRDALEVMSEVADSAIDTVLYDPVYSTRQQGEMYPHWSHSQQKNYKNNGGYFRDVEREIMRIVRPRGRALKFMWNSKSMPGFKAIGGMIVAHGAQHNDTICTAFERVQGRLDDGPTLADGHAALPGRKP